MSPASNKETVVVITPFFSPNVGGAETFANDLVSLFVSKDRHVTVLTYQPLTSKSRAPYLERGLNKTIFRLPWFSGRYFYLFERVPILQMAYLGTGLLFMLLAYCIFTIGRPKRVLALGLSALCVGAMIKSVFKSLRLECVLLTIYRFSSRPKLVKILNFLSNKVDSYYCLSKECADDVTFIPRVKNVITFNLWVDQTLHFYRRDLKDARALIKKNRIPDDRKIALFVARFSPEKGVQYLIDVINKKLDGWHFIVVGDGPLSHDFEVLTSENSKSITRIKSVENSMLPLYYSCADILIFGPADKDYLGRTAIECLSCGTPVLIYNQSTYFGQPEELSISENIESGILVVNSPLENCEKVLSSIKGESISFNTFLIRSAAVKSYSDSNGDCFL